MVTITKSSLSSRHKPRPTDWTAFSLQASADSGSNRVFSLIGGGGKTSLMYQWAAGLKSAGHTVVTTATTRLADEPREGISITRASSLADAVHQLKRPFNSNTIATLISDQKSEPGKLTGISPEWIDQLSQLFPFTFFLVEADGSAGRSLKGHLAHEPVIPSCSSLVIPVIGIDAIGKRISEVIVHHLEQFCRITGTAAGESIDEAMIVKALFSLGGYLHNTPATATIVPYINKIETLAQCKTAKKLSELIFAGAPPQMAGVLAGSIFNNYLVLLQ